MLNLDKLTADFQNRLDDLQDSNRAEDLDELIYLTAEDNIPDTVNDHDLFESLLDRAVNELKDYVVENKVKRNYYKHLLF